VEVFARMVKAMEQTQNPSEQQQAEQQQRLEQERSKLVVYTVKLPNGVKFTRLSPVH
jgi:phosphoribosyl-dephospho-CoA transferase